MNKAIRIVSIVMLTILVIGALSTPVCASLVQQFNPYVSAGSNFRNIFNSIIGIVQVVGSGIAVIMLMYLGIKYLISAPEGKAEIKKTAVPFVVGAVILFAAVNILAAVERVANNIRV